MEKEKILEMSRKENKDRDIYELEIIQKASNIALRVGLMSCCLIAVLDVIFSGNISFGSWTIYFGTLSTVFIVKYSKLRKKHELFVCILYAVCFCFFLTLYMLRLWEVI